MSTEAKSWPANITSPEQVKQALTELERLKDWHKENERSARAGAVTTSPPPKVDVGSLIYAETDWRKANPEEIGKLIADAEAKLASSPEVHITLPSLPDDDIKQDLANWFRNNISPNTLISFNGDSTLGGGMAVRTKNHIYNFSLSRQLWEQRHLIPGIVRDA